MNSKEISKLIYKIEDELIAEHRFIKENVMLKEKVLDYARRLDEANYKIDCLADRVEELEEELEEEAERQRDEDLKYYSEQMFELEVRYQKRIAELEKKIKDFENK